MANWPIKTLMSNWPIQILSQLTTTKRTVSSEAKQVKASVTHKEQKTSRSSSSGSLDGSSGNGGCAIMDVSISGLN
eukprot:scaffold421226_cov55-Attheya_sp.AAC.6